MNTEAAANPLTLPGGRRQLPQIQWLRGLAATVVMLYHTAAYRHLMFHDDSLLSWFGPPLGYYGVALFFAISGYLMSVAIRAQTPVIFLAHRIARIYPIYILASLAAYGLIEAFGPHVSYGVEALPLMPVPELAPYLYLRIEWTLIFEIGFYVALFAVAVLGQARHIARIALAWLGVMVVISLVSPDEGARVLMPVYQMLTVSTCVPMAGGLLLPFLAQRRVPRLLLLAGAVLPWCLAERYAQNYDASRWIFGISAVFSLWTLMSLPENARLLRNSRTSRLFARWGDYSYGLYLCHVAVISLVYKQLADLPKWQLWAVSVLLAIVTAVGLGWCDLALYARLKRGLRSVNSVGLRRAVLAYVAVYAIASLYGSERYFVRDWNLRQGRNLAELVEKAGTVTDPASAERAAAAAGFEQDTALVGHLDKVGWNGEAQRLYIDLWVVNARSRWRPVRVALFRAGQLVGVDFPTYTRKDVSQSLYLGRRTETGMHFNREEALCDPRPIVAIALTGDRRYSVLPGFQPPSCP